MAQISRRSDIQGLRAVAILAVVAYHAGLPVPGGYVGVDVFFVISGYLITQLLWGELAAGGRLSFAGFYARRARRLLPSAVLVILVTVVASVAVLGPLEAKAVAKDAVACALYVGNYRFAFQATNYLNAHGRSVAPAELLVARRRGAVLPCLAGAAPRRLAHRPSSPRPPPTNFGRRSSLGRYRRHGCRRSPLILDVRLFDAHGRALGLLLTAHEGVGTCGGRTPCARSTPRSTGPGVGSGDHRLGRSRRRGMVACRLRSTNTLPRGGRTCPGDGHRSGARRRHPQSDSRAGASARSGSPAADRRRLLHLVPLALAGARACSLRRGAPSRTHAEPGCLPVQPAPGGSDHRPSRAAGPAITMAHGSHHAQPRRRRSAQSRRRVRGCGDRGGGAAAGGQWSRHRLTTGDKPHHYRRLVVHEFVSGDNGRLYRRAGQPTGIRVACQLTSACIAHPIARRRSG